jgi:hypothetical protein
MTTQIDTANATPVTVDGAVERSVELQLARIHLRLGSLALARTELEILSRQGLLDRPGQVDLAEVRWRSGDLTSAGEAAALALAGGDDEPMALAIAAEAAAALGRPNEARRLANRALACVDRPIDVLFAGMPRSAVWPADASEPAPTAGTLFHHEPSQVPNRRAGDVDPEVVAARAHTGGEGTEDSGGPALTLGFWDADRGSGAIGAGLPDPGSELEAGRVALRNGANDEAVLRFALALRLAPALAPAILEATDGMVGPAINVVRGDAYRLVGLEAEAQRAFAAAAWSGARDRRARNPESRTRRRAGRRSSPETPSAQDEAPDVAQDLPADPPDTAAAAPET